jgi:hypothetical protein
MDKNKFWHDITPKPALIVLVFALAAAICGTMLPIAASASLQEVSLKAGDFYFSLDDIAFKMYSQA